MKKFKVNRKRDAFGPIRGFVYQVELTIQRWLQLEPNSVLELERGEDVDTIQDSMLADGTEQTRLLEQIKARESKLTLRASPALEALASFYEHEVTNPGLNLSYRYVTNAEVTVERPSPVPDKTPLVTLWNQLHKQPLTDKIQSARLKLIRDFLVLSTKPENFNSRTWKRFLGFVKRTSHKKFYAFVRKVEWLTSQDATDLAADTIQEILISRYGADAQKAQIVYSVLFLHVFKLLTRPGIKRLTPADRDTILAAPQVDERDRALLANLEIYLTDLTARVEALEEDVASLKEKPLATGSEIRDACWALSSRIAKTIIYGQTVIERATFRIYLDEFLTSHARYCFVLGPSGVGKSISIAMDVERLSRDQTVLLIPGKYFSLDEATSSVAQELAQPSAIPSWQKLVESVVADNHQGRLLLFIDAIDETDELDKLSLQLAKLHYSIGAISAEQIKVIISCRDIAWGRFRQQRLTPLYGDSNETGKAHSVSGENTSVTIRLADFSTDELDRALAEIGATELLESGRFGHSPSPHILTVRDLLKHPATFEHYAALKRTNSSLSIQAITWSQLIEARLGGALEKTGRQCGDSVEFLRATLVKLAVLGWEAGSKSFDLDVDTVRAALPELDRNSRKDGLSPRAALIENRVLNESVLSNQRMIGFQITDIGAYLLSIELERQIATLSVANIHAAFDKWLTASWNFQPLLDAMLALVDRLLNEPYSSRSIGMVEVLVESQRFHDGSIFGLMRPEVLQTIFEIIREGDEDNFYGYRDAALQVRPFVGALQEIRSHLKDENSLIRQLAAELAGAHQDEVSISELIELLRDGDDDVRRKAYRAFGHIGLPAISGLLATIRDLSKPIDLRTACLNALRNIGYRNSEISAVIKFSFEEPETNRELVRSTLLTAAHLRDSGHAEFASQALADEDAGVAQAAAKYLTEVPDPEIYEALNEAIGSSGSSEGDSHQRVWNLSQLMLALFKANRAKARAVLTRIFRRALAGHSELTPHRAIQISEKFDIQEIPPMILRQLVEQLGAGPEPQGKSIWRSARVLGEIWRVEHLDSLIKANRKLEDGGIDTAKLFVDAIIPGIEISEEFRIGNRLNLTSDLLPTAKCQSMNFGPEAARLLAHSGVLSCMDLCRWLWVAGDTRAEEGLVRRFENPSEDREAIHERPYVARALGTCGDTLGAQTVLNYLRNRGEELPLDVGRTTLYPLLTRKVVKFRELIDIARDTQMHWWSRSASLIALSLIDTSKFSSLFEDVVDSTNDQPRLQSHAVRLMGSTKDRSFIPKLRGLLANSEHLAIREDAAECLAWLDDTSSVHAIERALEDSHALGFASALAHFRQESSLTILLKRLGSVSLEWRRGYVEALGAFWKYPRGKAAILDQFDRWSSYEEQFISNQSGLIEGLAEHEPDVILDQFNKSFDDGHLTTNARDTMALWIARLLNLKTANEGLLLKTANRLLCDKHVPARERTANSLMYATPTFCLELFQQLHDSPHANEWERASAVYALGFWNCPVRMINEARFDSELLVRKAGDAALAMRSKRKHLLKHFEMFKSGPGPRRLSSYICLADEGDQSAIWGLYDDGQVLGLPLTFRKHLANRITERLTREYRKKQDEEKDLSESRGTITFD